MASRSSSATSALERSRPAVRDAALDPRPSSSEEEEEEEEDELPLPRPPPLVAAGSSRPEVSTTSNRRSPSFPASEPLQSRVTWDPGVSRTRAWREPVRRLNRADLPTLGLPRRTTTGRGGGGGGAEEFPGRGGGGGDDDGRRRCCCFVLLPPPLFLLLPVEIEPTAEKERNETAFPLPRRAAAAR